MLHSYLPEFLAVATLHMLALMAPGPDFILTTRNSLVYGRKPAIFAAIGLALGNGVHITYSLIGIGYIISKSILLFSALKFLGAGYLMFIGYKSLKAKPAALDAGIQEHKTIGRLAAIKMGLLTNISNPKVTLFYFALFTQVIHPFTPVGIKMLYGLEMCAATFVWFALVATLLSQNKVQAKFAKIQYKMEKFMGAALILLGLKVALSKAK